MYIMSLVTLGLTLAWLLCKLYRQTSLSHHNHCYTDHKVTTYTCTQLMVFECCDTVTAVKGMNKNATTSLLQLENGRKYVFVIFWDNMYILVLAVKIVCTTH